VVNKSYLPLYKSDAILMRYVLQMNGASQGTMIRVTVAGPKKISLIIRIS
jgi:hypothetical protein